jgi:DNA-binding Lrp family transcriptional regulator
LDKLDISLLNALAVNHGVPPGIPVLRKSFRSLARDLQVDQATVRRRMRRFQESGVLVDWYLGVNPALTGHRIANVWLEVETQGDKRKIVERLLMVRGVERVCNYLGSRLSFVLVFREDEELGAALKQATDMAGLGKVFYEVGAVPPPNLIPSATDMALIGSLGQDPWKPNAAVARELRLSTRTVKRRITRLSENGAIYMLPVLDLRAIQGILPVELVVYYTSTDERYAVNKRVMAQIRDEVVFSRTAESHGYFALNVVNAARLDNIQRWAKQEKGVKGVHTEVLQEVILNKNYYGKQKETTLEEVGREEIPREARQPRTSR